MPLFAWRLRYLFIFIYNPGNQLWKERRNSEHRNHRVIKYATAEKFETVLTLTEASTPHPTDFSDYSGLQSGKLHNAVVVENATSAFLTL